MGEKETKPFQLSFNGLLKVDFQGSHVTSDGGLILVRELDERLGLGKLIEEHLNDPRQGLNKKFPLADLLLLDQLDEPTAGLHPHCRFDSEIPTFQRPSASLLIGVQALSGRQGGQHPMGEKENKPFQLSFNGSLKIDFQGSRVTSDGGLILVRELDERLGLGKPWKSQPSSGLQRLY